MHAILIIMAAAAAAAAPGAPAAPTSAPFITEARSGAVFIGACDRVVLRKELWSRSKPAIWFEATGHTPPAWNEEAAREAVTEGYIDYFLGRCIKTDLRPPMADPKMYDRDNGAGAFETAVRAAWPLPSAADAAVLERVFAGRFNERTAAPAPAAPARDVAAEEAVAREEWARLYDFYHYMPTFFAGTGARGQLSADEHVDKMRALADKWPSCHFKVPPKIRVEDFGL